MMWWNNKEVNDLKEKRVDNRRELDDIRDTVHEIKSDVKGLATSKQNKLSFGWVATVGIVCVSGVVSVALWAGTINTQLTYINTNLQAVVESRFTPKDAITQFGIRDDAIERLTTSIETQTSIQTDMNTRIDSLEQSITSLYLSKKHN